MSRLFVALSMPNHIKDALSALQYGVDGARWRSVENFHLTLAFIGDADRHGLGAAIDALSEIEAPDFNLRLSGVGLFGSRKPRAIWVGITPSTDLMHLQRKVDGALRRKGIELETRKFIPHVTLAYLKGARRDEVANYCVMNELFSTEEFPVRQFHLYSSILGATVSHYEIEASYSLSSSK
ncbi:MAG: RNA 2',3'-cyclic phosphodiesterase [Alphaproteobacteria bacterium]|nr:RNA 2',3'-cyclic phosphodiesterase [Alphaproteobacteria bacterium]